MALIVTGSIGIDSVETPAGVAEDVLGGSSVYFAAAASFFAPVRVVGAVGEDFPDHFFDVFREFNIDLRGVEKRLGSKTFRWRGRYHENMNDRDTVKVELNVLAEALPCVPPDYRDSKHIFLANTDPASQMELLSNFPHRRLVVADTMDLWITTQRDLLLEMIARIDGLVLNDREAQQLTGHSNLVRAAEAVVDLGPQFVVIKKGEHGSLLHHRDGQVVLPAYPTAKVIDPTGAGDSFAGGMMGCLAAGQQDADSLDALKLAMACGTIVASFNVEAFSLNRLRQITRKDIDTRLTQYRQMLKL